MPLQQYTDYINQYHAKEYLKANYKPVKRLSQPNGINYREYAKEVLKAFISMLICLVTVIAIAWLLY